MTPAPDRTSGAIDERPYQLRVESVVFGTERSILGRWHEPETRRSNTAVVMCNPLGYEYMSAFRGYRVLAGLLAADGYPVLRFDYSGTGDSAGTSAEPGLLLRWRENIASAIEFVRANGCQQVVLFGVRIGAALAVQVAAHNTAIDGLVLWAPVVDGRRYERELRALAARSNSADHSADSERTFNASGFALLPDTLAELRSIDVTNNLDAALPPTLLLVDPGRPTPPSGIDALTRRAAVLTKIAAPGTATWIHSDPTLSSLPSDAEFQQIRNWFATNFRKGNGDGVAVSKFAVRPALDCGPVGVVEHPMMLGSGEVFVIETVPNKEWGNRPAIVLINSGRDHHIGPGRQWVEFSRLLATLGIRTIRLDLSGIGESPPRPGQSDNKVFSERAMEDLSLAVEYLNATGNAKVILMSLCSGAYLATKFASRFDVAGVIAINPFYFDASKVNPAVDDAPNSTAPQDAGTGPLRTSSTARIRRKLDKITRRIVGRTRSAKGAIEWVKIILQRETPFLLLYGEGNEGLAHFRRTGSSVFRQLRSSPTAQLQVLAGLDHGMLNLDGREKAMESASTWIREQCNLQNTNPTAEVTQAPHSRELRHEC